MVYGVCVVACLVSCRWFGGLVLVVCSFGVLGCVLVVCVLLVSCGMVLLFGVWWCLCWFGVGCVVLFVVSLLCIVVVVGCVLWFVYCVCWLCVLC